MKAKLFLLVTDNDEWDSDDLVLNLLLDNGTIYPLYKINSLKDNIDDYKNQLEYAVNNASLIMTAIPGIKLFVGDSVITFIDGHEEEIGKFIRQLTVEI